MTTKLRFAAAEVRLIVEHTQKATDHRATYGGTPAAALWLVKDQGVYLMSSAKESLPGEGGKMNKVVYAKGYDPDKDADVWEKGQDAMGGDDCVNALPLEWFVKALAENKPYIELRAGKRSISISLPK